jgi:hypothetical protein
MVVLLAKNLFDLRKFSCYVLVPLSFQAVKQGFYQSPRHCVWLAIHFRPVVYWQLHGGGSLP